MLRKLLAGSALSLMVLAPLANADNLADIYELALQNDPTIKAAEASYNAGKEAETLGRSELLPQVSANAGISYDRNENRGSYPFVFSGINPANKSDTDTTSQQYGVTLQQPVFNLPAWFHFQRGKELSQQATAQFAADQQDLIIRVAQAYFQVLRAISNLDASRAQEAATKRQLEQTKQRFHVGLIAITDVHEAQASYDLSVANRLADQGALGVAKEQLSVLTGREHSNIWLLKKNYPVAEPDPMQASEWVQFALKNNYDIKVAAYARDAAHESAKANKAEHLPKLTAQLGYQQNNTDNQRDDLFNALTTNYHNDTLDKSASLNLTMPLYAGGGVSAASRQAYAEYNRAVQQYAGAVRNAIQNTRATHISVVTDVARTNARKQAITSSQSALDATQAGYEVGTRNIVDVLNAQQTLYGAIRDYANARYDYVIDMLQLKRLAGTLAPQDIYDLNKWLTPPPPPTKSGSESSSMQPQAAAQPTGAMAAPDVGTAQQDDAQPSETKAAQ